MNEKIYKNQRKNKWLKIPTTKNLMDYVQHSSDKMRIGSIMGLGIAYAGHSAIPYIWVILFF